jgi:hypothetical protein
MFHESLRFRLPEAYRKRRIYLVSRFEGRWGLKVVCILDEADFKGVGEIGL